MISRVLCLNGNILHHVCHIGMYPHIHGHRRFMQFRFVDIYHNLISIFRKFFIIITDLSDIHPTAKHQQQITVLDYEITASGPHTARPSTVKRVPVPQQIMGIPRGHHRNLQGINTF